MTVPVGEDSWVDFVDQESRAATNLESRVEVLELFRRALSAEPYSIKIWMAYCEYFWSLHIDCQSNDAGWSPEEQQHGREAFSLDAALHLWQEGYEAVRYRLGDSHELWNRWIALEMEQLAKTGTEQGVKRITHLFKNRLAIPHSTWDETSQMFSSFLSEYNANAYESEMQQMTEHAKAAKEIYEPRDVFEMKLRMATRSGNLDKQKAAMGDYLDWEIKKFKYENMGPISAELCLGIFSRSLTGVFALDESAWTDYIVFISSAYTDLRDSRLSEGTGHVMPKMLDVLQRAVQHCPWSGTIWARYILSAEQAGLSFSDIELIKHAATGSSQLDRDGMTGVLEMYTAWCGYLKRTAMNPHATEEAVDLADVGLTAALEDVRHWGKRKYGEAYQGDPNFRLEKIYVQYLTEKHEAIEEARAQWNRMSSIDIHANSYDFWLHFYTWEMRVFQGALARSPTPSTLAKGLRVPMLATRLFERALERRELDWPEKVMDVYLQHCNDYERPETLLHALDTIYNVKKDVARRREQAAQAQAAQAEAAYAAAEYAAKTQRVAGAEPVEAEPVEAADDSPTSAKRKRESVPGGDEDETASKRAKNEVANGAGPDAEPSREQKLKRDRENTSVIVTGLPADVTMTKVRQYFRDYGHVNNIKVRTEKNGQSSTAFVEFRTPEDARSALLRDGKYFGQQQISVKPATNLTLFVTNYPPHADDKYIREVFEGCGEIFSIRWPSLKFNTHRRFCYVTFRDQTASAKATELDGTVLEEKYKLEAKYSDPAHKKARGGATEEGREVHVQNLHTDATESDVRQIFAKYGTVSSVRILRTMAGKSKGVAFAVFEKKDAAEQAAAELDKTKFRGQLLGVAISKPAVMKFAARTTATSTADSQSPGPSAHDDMGDEDMPDEYRPTPAELKARTIAVLGIPDTVNDTRVHALLDPLGRITKMTLYPARGGALVEFADPVTAGKASLEVGRLQIEGRALRVGEAEELYREKGEIRVDRVDLPAGKGGKKSGLPMMAPPGITRPRGGGMNRGPRRTLGFLGPVNKKSKEEGSGSGSGEPNGTHAPSDGQPPTKKRTNAEFKAMFLGGM